MLVAAVVEMEYTFPQALYGALGQSMYSVLPQTKY